MSYKFVLKKFGRVHSPWTRSLYLCKRKKDPPQPSLRREGVNDNYNANANDNDNYNDNHNHNPNDNYFNGTQRHEDTKFFLNTKFTNEIRKLGIYITIITKTK